MPMNTADADRVIQAAAEEAFRVVNEIEGELAGDLVEKAREFKEAALALAYDVAEGALTGAQFAEGLNNLKLAAASAVAGLGNDVYAARTKLAASALQIVLKAASAALA